MSDPNVFQIAAGTPERYYTDIFLKHDIMFMGPGDYGDVLQNKPAYEDAVSRGMVTSNKFSQVHSFATSPSTGDIVLMRNAHKVVAIGLVWENNYRWDDGFDDVFGWDLQHTRRVIWNTQLSGELEEMQKSEELFGHMRSQGTFSSVHIDRVIDRISHLFPKLEMRDPNPMPEKLPKPLGMDELSQELFSKGLPYDSVHKVIQAISRQRNMIRWYYEQYEASGRPTEHEVVGHMILPLMQALGWSEQLLAIEWNKIDMAAFDGTPTTPEKCVLVCEAKGLGHGLQNVYDQGINYIRKHKLDNCRKLLLTDGARLYLYERQNGDWQTDPSGYLNVMSIRTNHIAPANTNAIDTIIALTPFGIGREVNR